MVIFQDSHRFELTVEAHDARWVARLHEWVPGRLQPTLHVWREFASHQDAVEALGRKWARLFPEDEPLQWREPQPPDPPPPLKRRRSPSAS